MIKFDKWVFPEGEQHLPGWMTQVNRRVDGRLTYQYGKYEQALPFMKNNRVAIDVGSHIGLWAWFMARDFAKVECFEPMQYHRLCWLQNMKDVPRERAALWEYALGAEEKSVHIATRTKGSSGDSGVIPGNPGVFPMRTLDSFSFENVDLIKIDCEGYEENVLRGALDTLDRCKPVVIVEQKGTMSEQYGLAQKSAVKLLESLGAVQRAEISGDHILSWD